MSYPRVEPGQGLFAVIERVRFGNASLRLGFAMHAVGDGRLVAEGHGTLVGYDYGRGASTPLPDELRELLARDVSM